jgi:hypothetical protein
MAEIVVCGHAWIVTMISVMARVDLGRVGVLRRSESSYFDVNFD